MVKQLKILIASLILAANFGLFANKHPVLQVAGDNIADVINIQESNALAKALGIEQQQCTVQFQNQPLFGSAFLIKAKHPNTDIEEVLIITATHVVQDAHMSYISGKNRLFVSPIGSGKIFSVLPKYASACNDAVVLCLENPDDINEILKTTEVHELMSTNVFECLKWFVQVNQGNNRLEDLTIFGCDHRGFQPEVFATKAAWTEAVYSASFEPPFGPEVSILETEAQIFGGISGGCVLFNNKVIGLVSRAYISKESLFLAPGETAQLECNKTCYITELNDIWNACQAYFHAPLHSICTDATSNISTAIDIDDWTHLSAERLPREYETHIALSEKPYQPIFSQGLADKEIFLEKDLESRKQKLLGHRKTCVGILSSADIVKICPSSIEHYRLQLCNEAYLFGR